MVPDGSWKEFAAFSGPELSDLTAWNKRIVLVGDSSHALSGAFGSGAGFAMEDGWVLAQALAYFENDLGRALSAFNDIRLPYYRRMYSYLATQAQLRAEKLEALAVPTEGERLKLKVLKGGKDMNWIYSNDIGEVWNSAVQGGGLLAPGIE